MAWGIAARRWVVVLLLSQLGRAAAQSNIACAHLSAQVCSHRGNLDNDDLQLLTAVRVQGLFGQNVGCADLDVTKVWVSRAQNSDPELVVGHPDDFETLLPSSVHKRNGSAGVEIDIKKIPRDMGKALKLPQLLQLLRRNSVRFVALELKDMDLQVLELMLQTLRQEGFASRGDVGLWYSPADVELYQQVHKDQYPDVKGILAMYDKPWRGNPAASPASLDEAAELGFRMVGPSIDIDETLLTSAVRQGFQVIAFGISTEEHVRKAARSGVQYMVSDKPVWLKSRLDALRSEAGCGGPERLLAVCGMMLAATWTIQGALGEDSRTILCIVSLASILVWPVFLYIF